MFDHTLRSFAVSVIKPRRMVRGNIFSVLLIAVILLGLVSAGEVQAYNISGIITNNTGQSGRVFLIVSNGVSGVSVLVPANSSNTSYTIHGVSNGNWQINAFLNSQGNTTQYANSPAGQANFSVSNADVVGVNLTVNSVTYVAPSQLNAPNAATCAPGGLISWNSDLMKSATTGQYVPESINIYWSTGSNPLPGTPNANAPITGNGGDVLFLSGLTAGQQLHAKIVPVVGGSEISAAASPQADFSITSPSGYSTVSGSVNSTGITRTGPLYMALESTNKSSGNFYCTRIASPADVAAYSISGVQAGTYQVHAVLDMNNNNLIDLGDIVNDHNNSSVTLVTADGSNAATAPDVYLSTLRDATVALTTVHVKSNGNDYYSAQMNVDSGNKMPVNVQITGCTGVSSSNFPIDVGLSSWGSFFNWVILPARPNIGDSCSLTVGYEDNSTPGSYAPTVAAVLDNFPSPIYPQGNVGPISTNSSLFAWTTPNPLPAGYYDYMIQLNDASGFNTIWHPQDNSDSNLSSNQLNALFNYDGQGPSSLNNGTQYQLGVVVSDASGNQAVYQQNFTPQGSGPSVSGFVPTTGAAGTQVTINGNTFGSNPSVYFAGVPVSSYSSRSNTQIIAAVPSGAPVGPIIVVGDSGVSGGSSSQFIPTVSLQGTASTSGNTPTSLSGNVTTIGLSPAYSEVTQTNFPTSGYTLNVPSGVPLTLHITSSGYLDTYSSITSQTYNQASPSGFTMWTASALSGKGVTIAVNKGLIHARVADWDNLNNCGQGSSSGCITGAVVTAASKIHPSIPYSVVYTTGTNSVGGTATASDGKYYVLNVDEGDYVTVTALCSPQSACAGYSFRPETFITHADAVSATKIKGTQLPIVTPSAANNPAGNPLATLTATEQSAVFAGNIYYTADGTDPTSSSTVQTYYEPSPSFPLTLPLNSGSTTLRFYSCNGHLICGSSSSAAYSVYSLGANTDGTGSGTLSSSTTGVGCSGSSCSGNLLSSTNATITANAAQGSTFSNWSGCTSVNGADCNITVSSNSNVTATFTVSAQNQLTVYSQGGGSGSVSSTPGGIFYSYPGLNTGSASFASATLTASANSGSTATWVGNCDSVSGNGTGTATCSINSMNMPKSATATFSPVACSNWLVFIAGTVNYYETVHDAYFGVNASGQTIQMQGLDITDSPSYTGSNAINLQGGYDCAYSSISGFTTVHGAMTFSGGAVNIANVIIQ